jgi:hypothetical protein
MEKHTASGRHVKEEVAFPRWASRELAFEARQLGEENALGELGAWSAKVGSGA